MYHSIGGAALSREIVVSERHFESHVAYLARRYQVVSLTEIADLARERRCAPGVVAVTLDDGYRDNYEIALPILRRRGCPAAVFVTVESVDSGHRLWPQALWSWLDATQAQSVRLQWPSAHDGMIDEAITLQTPRDRARARTRIGDIAGALDGRQRPRFLRLVARGLGFVDEDDVPGGSTMLDWAQVRDMQRSGLVLIASHTMTHPRLSGLEPAAVDHELRESRRRLQDELDADVRFLAYPFGCRGDFTEQTKRAAEAAGYSAAWAAEDIPGSQAPDHLALPRRYVADEPAWSFAVRLLLATRESPLAEWLLAQ
jgi:peptidoglycan/xylan/chitin deacetylase (PgdA/CDA1 family)